MTDHEITRWTAYVRDVADRDAADVLGAWRRRTLDGITAAVVRALSDSVEFADVEAGVDVIHPDYLEAVTA